MLTKIFKTINVNSLGDPKKLVNIPIKELTALAILDTNVYLSGNIYLEQYQKIAIKVKSTLDNVAHNANPSIRLYDSSGTTILNGSFVTQKVDITKYSGEIIIINETELTVLKGPMVSPIKIGVICTTNAPTTGSISVTLLALPV